MIVNDLACVLDLDGTWQFSARPEQPGTELTGSIAVPGCWEAQGYPKSLDGPVHYRRTFTLPSDWAGLPVMAEFDAVSYAAAVRCNGQLAGRHAGLWTPFAVDLSSALRPGANTLELVVTKPSHALTGGLHPMRTTLAGFLPDVATTFGGLWQSARLRAVQHGFDTLQIDADPLRRQIRVGAAAVVAHPGAAVTVQVEVRHAGATAARHARPVSPGAPLQLQLPLPDALFWSPAQPALYTVQVELVADGEVVASATRRVGFRRLAARGEQLLLNGEPICLRGALSWGWNPASIAPRYTADQARAELRTLRELGFNLVKLCLFVPNQVYYDVADEEGMLLWQEWPLWLPDVSAELRARAPSEYADYMRLTRSHPSVVIYSLGCELDSSVDHVMLQELDAVARGAVEHVLFCDNSGSGEAYGGLAEDFADFTDYHTYSDLQYLEPVLDHWRRDWLRPRPWLFGEFCDSDGFRNRRRLLAANGGQPPWWLTAANPASAWRPEMRAVLEYDERMAAADFLPTEQELLAIAAAQSLMVRKYTLEAVRKRRRVQGYVITGLIDTPIATSGVLDDFGDPKWEPAVFRQCNDDAILCLDAGRSRVWQHGGDRPQRLDVHNWWAGAPIHLYVILNHTSPQAITRAALSWRLAAHDGAILAAGSWEISHDLPAGFPCELGQIVVPAPLSQEPQAATLHVQFDATTLHCRNQWPLWIYPRPHFRLNATLLYDPIHALESEWRSYARAVTAPDLHQATSPAGALGGVDGVEGVEANAPVVVVSTVLDEPIRLLLQHGGRVLLLQTGDGPLPGQRVPFWREAIKLPAPHSLWRRFPHAGFVDLQFFGLACDVAFDTQRLAAFLPELQLWTPILRRLDARQFTLSDYLFSAAIGGRNGSGDGRLVACALRLHGGAGSQPTGLQCNVAGQYLLAELLQLLRSPAENPVEHQATTIHAT